MELSFGAETNIEDVEVHWAPFGLTVTSLAQTDAAEPEKNLFEVASVQGQIDLWQMLLGKYSIEQLTLERVRLGATRAKPGEVFKSPLERIQSTPDAMAKTSESLGLSVPSADDVLSALNLESEVKARALQQTWQEEKPKLEQAFKQLPNKAVLEQLKADWKKLSELDLKSPEGLATLRKELQKLKVKIDKERAALKLAKQQYEQSKEKLDTGYQELKQAGKNDWQKLEQQIDLSDPNAGAIAKLLFGQEVAEYLEQGQEIWHKVQPFIENQKQQQAEQEQAQAQKWSNSRDVEFPLAQPMPDWIVKKLAISVVHQERVFQLTGTDINIQSYVLQKPSVYQISDGTGFELSGEYFVDRAMTVSTNGNWTLAGQDVVQKQLSDSKDLNLTLAGAKVSGKGQYGFANELNSATELTFNNTNFSGEGSTRLAKLTLDTLENVDAFKVDIGVNGDLNAPAITVKSDLDKQLSQAFKSAFSQEWSKVKKDTQNKLNAQLKQQFNLDDTELAQWQEQLAAVTGELDVFGSGSVEDMVKQQQKAFQDKLKDKAKDKIKDKLKDLFGGE